MKQLDLFELLEKKISQETVYFNGLGEALPWEVDESEDYRTKEEVESAKNR